MKLQSLILFLLIFCYCAANLNCPASPIKCLWCIDRCPENYTLVHSPCGCCYDQCVPNEKCPKEETKCPECINSCPKGEILKLSPCGCCYNKCVPGEPTTSSPNEVSTCPHCATILCPIPLCIIGYVLVDGAGYCGCCPGCVNETLITTTTEAPCPPDICQRVRCAIPTCKEGYILEAGAGFCGCCPDCVKPRRGHTCYTDYYSRQPTCGCELKCCNGRCIPRWMPCSLCEE